MKTLEKRSMKFVLILGQCFALMPVEGVSAPNPTALRFKWVSWKALYTALSLIGSVFFVIMSFLHLYKRGHKFPDVVEQVFFMSSVVTTVLFVHLAYKWPRIITEWTKVDVAMQKNYGYPKKLDKKLKTTTFVLMFMAFVEYVLSLAFHYVKSRNQHRDDFDVSDYFVTTFPQIFEHVPYSHWAAAFAQVVSCLCTFTWTFNDLFIMLVSTAVALRFQQVTERLKSYKKKATSYLFWIEIREDYDRICNLCTKLDETLSFVVVTSFGTNLFFILVQLFNTIKILREDIEKVYFFCSFGFLIIRTVAVSLYAASINDESKNPADVLNSLPSEVYNDEISRFLRQISFDNVALTGIKMFKVTRGLILNVAGAIVTYELVLIQFNEATLRNSE